MGKLGDKYRRALRPDAQAFDAVYITTVPRYKTSGLSGDEWRISVKLEFYRKGQLRYETSLSNMEYVSQLFGAKWVEAIENGNACYGGEDDICDQEGCEAKATVTYRLKKEYCREGHASDPTTPTIRMFCDRHKQRGDCGLEDADANYELLPKDPA